MFAIALLAAAVFEDLPTLDARIAAIAQGAAPIDPRIRLARCPEPAAIEPVSGGLAIRCPALGWRLRVAVVQSQTESGAPLVRRGESVELVYAGGGFMVSGFGVAMDDAAAGKPVRVKIPTSAAPVTAIVAAAGIATVSR